MSNLARLADRVLNTPLLIHPAKLSLISQVLSGRIGIEAVEAISEDLSPEASAFVGQSRPRSPYRVEGSTAIVAITGSTVNRGAFVGAQSGVVSYEGIAHQIKTALADPKVARILLDIDSPGGEAIGAFETAAMIREANKTKPVFGSVNGMAASAGYALASGCRAIVATPSSIIGSIGVVVMHSDFSRAMDKVGIATTFIHAGKHKVDANPYAPLSKSVRADLQKEIDEYYGQFLRTVGAGRGARMPAVAARKTEAKTFIGADAKAVGLVDDIGSFDEILSMISTTGSRQSKGVKMAIDPRFTSLDYDPNEDDAPEASSSKAREEEIIDARISAAGFERARMKRLMSLPCVSKNPLAAFHEALNPGATAESIEYAVNKANSTGQAAADAAWAEIAERHNAELARKTGEGASIESSFKTPDPTISTKGAYSIEELAAKLNGG